MMMSVADRNESHDTSGTGAAPGPESPSADEPEIVDAEVVPTGEPGGDPAPLGGAAASPATGNSTTDDEEFRRYQEFLEFQRFREWQRSRGESPTDGPVAEAGGRTGGDVRIREPDPSERASTDRPGSARPGWKRALGLLRYKFVRRILYVLLILLLAPYALSSLVEHYLGAGSSGSGGGSGNGGVPADSVPVKSTNPKQAVRGLYNWLGSSEPERVCGLFEPGGRAAFAQEHGAADCTSAARELNGQVTDANDYANPKFGPDAVTEVGDEAQVLGCRLQVSGGPQLGTFKFEREQDGGWAIAAYSTEATSC